LQVTDGAGGVVTDPVDPEFGSVDDINTKIKYKSLNSYTKYIYIFINSYKYLI
jgi:hypothetical protein